MASTMCPPKHPSLCTLMLPLALAQGYRVHVHLEKSWGANHTAAPTLSYWCFIPGMAFRMLKALSLRRWGGGLCSRRRRRTKAGTCR